MKPTTVLFGHAPPRKNVFQPEVMARVARHTDLIYPILSVDDYHEHRDLLEKANFILSTWGMPELTGDFLAMAPKLKAVFYAAGSVKSFVTDESWDRGVVICSAAEANAIPVAEYTLSTILLSLKRFWHHTASSRQKRWQRAEPIPGAYKSKVGLISLGAIARRVAAHLARFEVEVLAYDPYVSAEAAGALGVRLVSLESLFDECDVVSLHAPWIPETVGMINRSLLQRMRPGATFINTARGALVNEPELCEVMGARPDLTAILDVTWPEPPAKDSPLYDLENIILTPHIAGSTEMECGRMTEFMADEIGRFIAGEPLRHQVTREMMDTMA